MRKDVLMFLTAVTAFFAALCAGDVILTGPGCPGSVIVVADKASPAAEYAAAELSRHLELVSGVKLPVVRESEATAPVRIYVGATAAAERVGLGQDKFAKEAWTVRCLDGALYLVGGENGLPLFHPRDPDAPRKEKMARINDNGLVRDARRGTLYAVYDFLDRELGIRWLWPGELGTFAPKKETIRVPDGLRRDGEPAFKQRHFRISHLAWPYYAESRTPASVASLNYSVKGLEHCFEETRRYLLIHHEGDSEPPPAPPSHLKKEWKLYGKKHPEWFSLNDNGKRGPAPGGNGYVRMCVSDPTWQAHVLENWDGSDWIGLGEGDNRTFCRCARCMEWDKPQNPEYRTYSTTNRYLRYAAAVREQALKRNPNVRISLLLYMDYLLPPAEKRDLSWISAKFVPWGSGVVNYYPMRDEDHRQLMKIWRDWRTTGIHLSYRPNYLLSGYTLPALDLDQCGEMLKLTAEDMEGFDFDALYGYWSTKGPMLYMHLRLTSRPDMSVAEALDEYYAGFGPAADAVRKYFDYWITYTKTLPSGTGGVTYRNALSAGELYPESAFVPAEKLLREAREAASASPDPQFVRRVEFLKLGLEHGRLCARFARHYSDNRFVPARKTLEEIIRFRHAHENEFFTDYIGALNAEYYGIPHLGDFIAGQFRYFFDPPLTAKKFRREECFQSYGLRAGKWALYLHFKHRRGWIVYKYETGPDDAFLESRLTVNARTTHLNNLLEYSFDGEQFFPLAANVVKQQIDLTPIVRGKSAFFVRFTAVRTPDAPEGNLMCLVKLRHDYVRKKPEAVVRRPKLQIGSGWMDFEGEWMFRKDPDGKLSAPIAPDDPAFKQDGWVKVPVPSRLSTTAAGPYLGYGWYAVPLEIPAHWSARDVEILFGAVDEQAWVYVNGKLAGEHTERSEKVGIGVLWNEPFIVRVKAADLRPGMKNLLVVRTHASRGEHGIWQPVRLRPVDASAL